MAKYYQSRHTGPQIDVGIDLSKTNENAIDAIDERFSEVEEALPQKYTKPSGGIPSTDLSSAVQTSLGKADTAVQDVSGKADKSEMSVTDGTGADADKVTIQLKSGTSATVLKTHQSITGKADKVSSPTNGNFAGLDSNGNLTDSGKKASDFQPTIDAQHKLDYALLDNTPTIPDELSELTDVFIATYGTTTAAEVAAAITAGKLIFAVRDNVYYLYSEQSSGYYHFINCRKTYNYTIRLKISTNEWDVEGNYLVTSISSRSVTTTAPSSSSTDSTVPTSKAVYDAMNPAAGTSQPSGGFVPNVFYKLGEISGSVTFALASPSDSNILNHYYWTFETGTTAPTITWPAGITSWLGGSAPTINANKHYEISVIEGIGTFMEV